MVSLGEYIHEAVALRTTGKYGSIWEKRISENSVWSDFIMAFRDMGANEICRPVGYGTTVRPKHSNRMVDWYSNRTDKRPVFSFVTARYYKKRIFILTMGGIGYSISLKGGMCGIDEISRYKYDWNSKTLDCTGAGYRKGGINRMLSEIKDILEK